jgi:hypothetical protein
MPSSVHTKGTVAGIAVDQDSSFRQGDATRDYGASLSTRVLLPVGIFFNFFAEGRYHYGMVDLSGDAAENLTTREISAYIGLLLNL